MPAASHAGDVLATSGSGRGCPTRRPPNKAASSGRLIRRVPGTELVLVVGRVTVRACPLPPWGTPWCRAPAAAPAARRLAVRTHEPVELSPGARMAYEWRGEIAAELLHRRGIDPTSAEYRAAVGEARRVLDQIDQLDSGPTT
jgi:hypothetical protein